MNTKYMNLEIQLTFNALIHNMPNGVSLDGLASALSYDGYSDGRQAFLVEVINDALGRRIRNCIDEVINQYYYDIHGNAMVKTSDTGGTSKAHLKACEAMKDTRVTGVDLKADGAKVSLTYQDEA